MGLLVLTCARTSTHTHTHTRDARTPCAAGTRQQMRAHAQRTVEHGTEHRHGTPDEGANGMIIHPVCTRANTRHTVDCGMSAGEGSSVLWCTSDACVGSTCVCVYESVCCTHQLAATWCGSNPPVSTLLCVNGALGDASALSSITIPNALQQTIHRYVRTREHMCVGEHGMVGYLGSSRALKSTRSLTNATVPTVADTTNANFPLIPKLVRNHREEWCRPNTPYTRIARIPSVGKYGVMGMEGG